MLATFCRLLLAAAVLPPASLSGSGGGAPSLDHSAPFLGHVLELELAGGAPGQSVRLLASPQADQVDLPVGTLELDREQLVVVANGTTAMDGTARFELPLSADPAAAESELHLQALVGDPGAPAGAVLSEAAHLRLLGPRVYVGCHGLPTSARAGDGDTQDDVLYVLHAGQPPLNIGLDTDGPVRLHGRRVIFAVRELCQDFDDLNGDGDAVDWVMHYFDVP